MVNVTENPKAILKSIETVRPQDTLLCAGLAGKETVPPIITDFIVTKELRFQGVLSKRVEVVVAALKLVEPGKYPAQKIVTHKFPLKEAERALKTAGGELPGPRQIKVALLS